MKRRELLSAGLWATPTALHGRGLIACSEPKRGIDRRQAAVADEVPRVDERVATVEADACREGIGHRREHMAAMPAPLVGRRQRLQRRRARGERQVERAADDLPGDRIGLGEVAFGVVTADRHGLAVHEAASPRAPSIMPAHGVVEH